MRDRHLARAEAIDTDLVLELRELASALLARSDAGTTTLNSRLRPSLTVSVTCITIFFVLCRSRRLSVPADDVRWCPVWCGRRDLNPHDLRHGNLNPARLPIPPRPPWAIPVPSFEAYSTPALTEARQSERLISRKNRPPTKKWGSRRRRQVEHRRAISADSEQF